MVKPLIKKLSMIIFLSFVLIVFIVALSDLEILYNNAGKAMKLIDPEVALKVWN